MKSPVLGLYPALRKIPIPVIFAEAPIGDKLPPNVAPLNNPKYNRIGSKPSVAEIEDTTGNIVATYGMLSMNADKNTLAQTIKV